MSREVMKMALAVLKGCLEHPDAQDSIIAIEHELAQPEQEPVAWMAINEYGEEDDIHYENPEGHLLEGWTYKPLYAHPPQIQQAQSEPLEYWNAVEGWVKIDEVRENFDSVGCGTIYKTAGEGRVPLCVAQPAQEPVGWQWLDTANFRKKIPPAGESECWNPVYASPPKREWVGLTNNEVNNFAAGCHLGKSVQSAMYEGEAKLKEKNGN